MSVRKLKYNDTVVELLNFNNNEVQVANYNGVVVYDNTGDEPPTPPTPPDPPEPTGDPVFEIYPEFKPHNNVDFQPRISSGTEYNIPECKLVGNSNFFIRTKVNNAGDIIISQTNPIVQKRMDHVYKIDNYGLGFFRSTRYNEWAGGSTPGSSFTNNVTFTSSKDSSLSKTLALSAETDEDNTTFIKGLFTAKLLRLPASAFHGEFTLKFFPYNFDSNYFYTPTSLRVVDASKVGETVDGTLVRRPVETNVDPSDNGTYVSTAITNSGLESTVNYSVTKNETGQYRYVFFRLFRQNWNTCEVHFIQESYSRNRIYYGNVPSNPSNWDGYADSPSDDNKYHVYFQFANSEIVTSSKEISALRADNIAETYYNIGRINVLCVPSELAHTITPSISSLDILSDNYMWGDQPYIIYKLASSADTTYTLNIG